jgi:hypothetical protein
VTILSRTAFFVRLTQPVRLAPGVAFQGEIEHDIRVNNEIAVPKGSVSHLTIVGGAARASDRSLPSPLSLRLTAVVIDNQTYGVAAAAVRIEPPNRSGLSPQDDRLPPQLPAGTRVEFRLNAPLVVTHI